VKFDLILTSPLVRAVQTAEILQKAGLSSKIEQFNPLSPNGNIQDWVQWWQKSDYQREENAIALVGHEPDLGYWTEMLVWGKFQGKLSVKKAGIIGLEVPNQENPLGKCQLFWLTAPKLLL
ncbi:MAG: phosphohistidine phosphatase SixA, partial [Microcystis panniformis]